MREFALLLLLIGVLAYLYPFYRAALPISLDLSDGDAQHIAAGLIFGGVILLAWMRFE